MANTAKRMIVLLITIACTILSMTYSSFSQQHLGPPPPTKVDTVFDTLHNVVIPDPYRWLEDGSSDEVRRWTEAQNAYFQKYINRYPERDQLKQTMTSLLSIGSFSSPRIFDSVLFYKHRTGSENHSILYVQFGKDKKPEMLIDPNSFSTDGTVALDWWFPSPDGSLVAYGKSSSGTERSTLYIIRTADKKLLDDTIPNTRYAAIAWLPDNSGFYYTRFAIPGTVPAGDEDYYRRVYFHRLGDNWQNDSLIFGGNLDKTVWTNVDLSPDGSKLFCSEFYGWSRIVFYMKDLSSSDTSFMKVTGNLQANFQIQALDDCFLIMTNNDAPHYRLFKARYDNPSPEHWRELIPEQRSIMQSFLVVDSCIVVRRLTNATSSLEILTLEGAPVRYITLPELGTVDAVHGEPDGTDMYFYYSSYNIPPTIYHYDFKNDSLNIFAQIDAGIDYSNIEVKQVWYRSLDSTPVSMFIVYNRNSKLDGNNPTYLYGYGGFNSNMTPYFSRVISFWVNQGGIYAVPNLRGGGEYGEEWHNAGKREHKQNTFDDFIAAAEYLFANGYTSPEKLCISGGSNGGLLIGAVLTQRPDLCRAAVCAVPLLDMIRYHKFLIARLWIPEYGVSDDSAQFAYLYSYSPYHHVVNGTKYPAVLFKASESDGRVAPLHARKMTARMQAANISEYPILLRLETKAGHGQGKPVSKQIEELTDTWSFVFNELGVQIRQPIIEKK